MSLGVGMGDGGKRKRSQLVGCCPIQPPDLLLLLYLLIASLFFSSPQRAQISLTLVSVCAWLLV